MERLVGKWIASYVSEEQTDINDVSFGFDVNKNRLELGFRSSLIDHFSFVCFANPDLFQVTRLAL